MRLESSKPSLISTIIKKYFTNMKITKLEPIILHAPVTRGGIADSTHKLTHWGAPGVAIHTDSGHIGYGFSGTHAHLPTDRLIVDCIVNSFGPLLIGEDPREVVALWEKLHKQSEIYWVGRAGITHLALGAIDIALWDLKAKEVGQPLWKLLGGSAKKKVEAYNTDGGWLNWSLETMVSDCKRLVEEEGYRAVKLKVGGPNPREDLRRVEAVRKALGPDIRIMTDANGRWTLPQAIQTAGRLKDFDIAWIEEPIYFDDWRGIGVWRKLLKRRLRWESSFTPLPPSATSFTPAQCIMFSRMSCGWRASRSFGRWPIWRAVTVCPSSRTLATCARCINTSASRIRRARCLNTSLGCATGWSTRQRLWLDFTLRPKFPVRA